MSLFQVKSVVEQVAAHLRDEIGRGIRIGTMAGAGRLADELSINAKTAEAAMRLLERDGWLINQGRRRGRLIHIPDDLPPTSLRIGILRFEERDSMSKPIRDAYHELIEAGHSASFVPKTLMGFNMKVDRVARYVSTFEADALVVISASSEILSWLSKRRQPAFAIYGERRRVPISGVGPDCVTVMKQGVRRLIELGHRRIVLLSRSVRHFPEPGYFERTFIAELKDAGVPVGAYNLPDWENSSEGLYELLDSLFKTTPPTALIVDEPEHFVAVLRFFAERGLRTPGDVSLFSSDFNPLFDWCEPPVAQIRWDDRKVARSVLRWASAVSRGKEHLRQTQISAEFVEGSTMGPPKK